MNEDRIEGKAKEVEGETQQTWGKLKDKAEDAWSDAKDKGEGAYEEVKDRLDGDDEPVRTEDPTETTSRR
jgi:uncharacterized protein YjbJ (UPF0337 family)